MASANIVLQQHGDGYAISASRDDLDLSTVTVLNLNNTGVTSWLWTLVEIPTGSSASLVAPTTSSTTFTPDLVGTYLVKLAINGGSITDQKGAGVRTSNLHYRIPASLETTEFDAYVGWSTATNQALNILDAASTRKSNTFDQQLTTTSATNVLNFTPAFNGNFVVFMYYRVANSTTNVTVSITWTDNAGAQTLNILPITAKTVGSYSFAPVYIQALTTGPIHVVFTTGTANNVFVSATIVGV